jgi:hypothetical protein
MSMAKFFDGLPGPAEFRESLRRVLDYSFDDERAHFHATHAPDHIFPHMDRLSMWMTSRRWVIVDRRSLMRLSLLAEYFTAIVEEDQADAEGGSWDSVYDDAREAARRLRLIQEHVHRLIEEKPLPARSGKTIPSEATETVTED